MIDKEVRLTALSDVKTIRRVTDFKAQREETYRYWRSRTYAERLEAVADIVRGAYHARGIDLETRPIDKTLVRVARPSWKAV
jgi:hypothetical protein